MESNIYVLGWHLNKCSTTEMSVGSSRKGRIINLPQELPVSFFHFSNSHLLSLLWDEKFAGPKLRHSQYPTGSAGAPFFPDSKFNVFQVLFLCKRKWFSQLRLRFESISTFLKSLRVT